MKENEQVRRLLESKFRELAPATEGPEASPPTHLKRDVFRTLDMLELMGDVSALFTVRFGETAASFIELLESSEEE